MIPTVTSAPSVQKPKHSLLDAANVITDSSNRWENGVTFNPTHCQAGHALAQGCPSPISPAGLECTAAVRFDPFIVEIALNWSMQDLAGEPADLARDSLETATSRLIEAVLWTGETLDPVTPTDPAVTPDNIHPLTGIAAAPSELAGDALGQAIGFLADASQHSGGLGIVHMNSVIANQLDEKLVLDADGTLYTKSGMHRVVVGNYHTDVIVAHVGELDVYLSEVEIVEGYDRAQNEALILAQRHALVAYNTCAAYAIGVDTGLGS